MARNRSTFRRDKKTNRHHGDAGVAPPVASNGGDEQRHIEAASTAHTSKRKKHDLFDWLNFVVLVAAFCAATWAAHEAERLADSTDTAITAADNAANEQRKISIDMEQRQLRAYIHIRSGVVHTIPKADGIEVTLNPIVKVYGQTPAGAVAPAWELAVFDYPMTDNTKFPSYLGPPAVNIESSNTYAPGEDRLIGAKTKLLSANEIAAIKTGKQALYAIGTILYVDIFRIPRFTNFCFSFDFDGLSNGTSIYCAIHNGADWNSVAEPAAPTGITVPMK